MKWINSAKPLAEDELVVLPGRTERARQKAANLRCGGKPTDSIASVTRELILAGLTNEQIWLIICGRFDLDASKKLYVAWYRGDMRRKGLLVLPRCPERMRDLKGRKCSSCGGRGHHLWQNNPLITPGALDAQIQEAL